MSKQHFSIEVSGLIADVYEIKAETLEEAEKLAKAQFKDDNPHVPTETIEAVEI